ncbi:MAG: hypothetical protein ACREUU_19860, partial [Gammaproteobacteria bacterium]
GLSACRAQITDPGSFSLIGRMENARCKDNKREGLVIRWMAWAIAALLKPKALLAAKNLLSLLKTPSAAEIQVISALGRSLQPMAR